MGFSYSDSRHLAVSPNPEACPKGSALSRTFGVTNLCEMGRRRVILPDQNERLGRYPGREWMRYFLPGSLRITTLGFGCG